MMKNPVFKEKSFYFIMVLGFVSCLISWKIFIQEFRQTDTVDIHAFPREFDGWVSREIKISDLDYAILETRNAFSREYKDPQGRRAYLFIVYSQTNRKVFHPPEICYTGGGATIVQAAKTRFQIHGREPMTANSFIIEKGSNQQVMYYWFKVGDQYTSSYWFQQLLVSWKNFLGRREGSALIRIAVPFVSDRPNEAMQTAYEFVEDIYPLLGTYLP